MKRITVFFMALLITLALTAQENKPVLQPQEGTAAPEKILQKRAADYIPGGADFFLLSVSIGELSGKLKALIGNSFSERERKENLGFLDAFSRKWGFDVLDAETMKKAGIDITRPFALSGRRLAGGRDESLVLIPAVSPGKAPLQFVNFIKSAAQENKRKPDLNPVISEFMGVRRYQSGRDIFFCIIDDYLVVSNTASGIEKSIKTARGELAPLSADPGFAEYSASVKEAADLEFYAGRNFFNAVSGGDSWDFIKYAFAGIKILPQEIAAKTGMKLDSENPSVKKYKGIFKAGEGGASLMVRDVSFYGFAAVDFEKIEELCAGGLPFCADYTEFKKMLKENYGIDFASHVAGSFSGAVNFVPGTEMGTYALFLHSLKPDSGRAAWDRLRESMKKQYGPAKRYGEGGPGFWIEADDLSRHYFAYGPAGVYYGNSPDLLKGLLNSGTVKEHAPAGGDFLSALNDPSVFCLLYLRKDSFIRNLIVMRAMSVPGYGALIMKTGDINIAGRLSGDFYYVDFNLEILRKAGR